MKTHLSLSCTLSSVMPKDQAQWKQCILCQESSTSKGPLVLNPETESYQKLLDIVKGKASLPDGKYVNIQRHLQECTKETMLERKAVWHCNCYSEATHEKHIQQDSDHMHHAISTANYIV